MIENIEVLEGDRSFDFRAVILDAAFAEKLLDANELALAVHEALAALYLSDRKFVIVTESEDA